MDNNNHENSRLSAIEAILERSALEAERRDAEFERRDAEFDRQMMLLKAEAERSKAEFDRQIMLSKAEADKRHAEFERQIMLSKAEADKRVAAADKRVAAAQKRAAEAQKSMDHLNASIEKTGQQIKQIGQQMGGMANSNGDMAQEFFYNTLSHRKTLFGQVYDVITLDTKRKIKSAGVEVQYDITLDNGTSFCIVEVKYKANTDDVKKMYTKMVNKFRVVFPEYAHKKLYLAMASMSFNSHVKKACIENGIAMIKPLGETIKVYDEHLKAF